MHFSTINHRRLPIHRYLADTTRSDTWLAARARDLSARAQSTGYLSGFEGGGRQGATECMSHRSVKCRGVDTVCCVVSVSVIHTTHITARKQLLFKLHIPLMIPGPLGPRS